MFLLCMGCRVLAIMVSKNAISHVKIEQFLGSTFIFKFVVLLCFIYFFKPASFKFYKKDMWTFAQITLMFYLSFLFGFWSLGRMPATQNALLDTLAPFVTAILVYVLYKRH